MISEYFIKRKIIAIAIFLMVTVFGLFSLMNMPVAQYPKLTPPTISISASYPGADAKTIETSVLEPIETQLSGLQGLMYTNSSSSNSGQANITCTFEIGTDINVAYMDIQNKLSTIDSTLPPVVKSLGISVKKKTSDILMIVAITSPNNKYNQLELSNYTANNILKKVRTIKGAGEGDIFGKKEYSMRIWHDPVKLASYGLTSNDIISAIKEQNNQVSIGRIGQEPVPSDQVLSLMIKSKGRLTSTKEFENIILKTTQSGSIIRIKDVARVELGTASYEFNGYVNGKPAVLMAIFADPQANALTTVNEVKKTLETLSSNFPEGITYSIPYDTTDFVKLSIKEVLKTFLESIVLVSIVIFAFLHSFRASIIPIIAIPVSIFGTFIVMNLLGFSINTLTLFGLVLSIGIIVDDAIVVVENIERLIKSEKLTPFEASIKAMKQITSPIIAIMFVIASVFIPTIFMGGITGELYKQFSLTIAIAVTISGIVALILSPVLASMLIKDKEKNEKQNKFDLMFERLTDKYVNFSLKMIKRKYISLTAYILFFIIIALISMKLPSTFLPSEDQGVFMTIVNLPEGSSVQRTNEVVQKIQNMYKKESSIANIISMVGSDSPSTAMVYSRLVPYEDRKDTNIKDLIKKLTEEVSSIQEAQIMIMQPPAIRGLGRGSGLQIKILAYGDSDPFKLAKVSDDFASKLNDDKENFMFVKNTTKNNSPVLYFELDRDKAKIEGVNISDIYSVLQSSIGYSNVNQFEKDNHLYWVQVQSEGNFRNSPEDIKNIFVKNINGKMIPLSELGYMTDSVSPSKIEHFNGVPSNSLMGMIMIGKGTADTMKLVEAEAKNLPAGYALEWEGMSYQEKISEGKNIIIFAFGIIMVFLILSIQYNSFILPITVILSVIFGVFGAYIAQLIISISFMLPKDIYFSIGLLTLIGLASKNAILIIEFAEELRNSGMSIYDSIKEASRIRYRPMIMTSIAFMFGIIPLIISSGAGAESRFSIGVGLFGGIIAATFIERYFIPYIYYYVATLEEKFKTNKEVTK
jgi:hydrophobe/amphiphile efflux-1 (HAE1) family protein